MTIVNVTEDSNNPSKYLIINSQGASSETTISTSVIVSSVNRLNVIEISKIKGDKGDTGEAGPQGPPGENGLVFDILPINSGGTNNTSFNNNKIIYYDGTKLTSSNIDINNIQTDIISNIYSGSGLSKNQEGQSVTINAALGEGLTLDAFNRISIDDTIITQYNFDLSNNYINGKLDIPYGGTNNTFFSNDKFIYFDGDKLASFPLSTGSVVVSGQKINIIAGSGLVGGGEVSLPNGSVVINLQNSADILVTNDSIELSSIVSSGIYSKVNVDSKGRVTQGSQITLNDLISYLGFTPWYSGNDGPGSNLDADLLDGHHGSYYLDGSNITGTISNDILPQTISAGSAPKVTFNTKGIIIDSGILSYLDITDGLGYVPFDKSGGQILGDVEILGDLLSYSGSFANNTLSIGSYDSSLDARGIRFKYGDFPQKNAVLGYFPDSDTFRIITENSSGRLITEEKADTKYVGITGYQEISGIKSFLDNISIFGRVIIRSKYASLPPIDIGTNNLLVLNLNADLLDGQHGAYYRNAANLTGILNEFVVLPHLEDRSSVYYSTEDDGALEYFPKFHRPYSGHPIVLKDSLVYETGYSIYMDGANLSVGTNYIHPDAVNTTLLGSNNSGTSTATNSLAIGQNNIVSGLNSVAINYKNKAITNNSIAMGSYAETWIDDQIAIGGFVHNNVGVDLRSIRDAHGQISYIPLKFHGEASNWINILNFPLPDNKTLEYSAELLFTKQKETGVASFFVGTGIVKNYGYRDPDRNYSAYKKTIKVTDHQVIENYNNSQERTYGLNIVGFSNIDQELNNSTLKITAPPLQYRPLSIENNKNPIIIEPISDHQTRLKAVKGNTLNGYRSDYVIKLSPFDPYPYNSGSLINLGKNIHNITECLYYRISGSPDIYIKFYNHGISEKCPLYDYEPVVSNNFKQVLNKYSNFNFYLSKQKGSVDIKCAELPSNGTRYRQYIDKYIYGSISGSTSFNIYQTSGLYSTVNYHPYLSGGYSGSINSTYYSTYYNTLQFKFQAINLDPTNKDWSKIDDYTKPLTITIQNQSEWDEHQLSINGYINPILGTLDFYLSNTSPLVGSGIQIGVNEEENPIYFSPDYYIDDLSFVSKVNPYSYVKPYSDLFKVIDNNTLAFSESQLCFIRNNNIILTPYPNNIKDITNFNLEYYNNFLDLNINDAVIVSGINTTIIDKYTDSNLIQYYTLSHNFNGSGISTISIANPISGIGYTDSRSFNTITGTYSYSRSRDGISPTTTHTHYFPTVYIGGGSVPTGSEFSYTLPGPQTDSSAYVEGIITSIISPFQIACTSIVIQSDNTNDIILPNIIIPSSTIIVDGVAQKYKLLDYKSMQFKVNDINIFDTYIPIFYSGYTGAISDTYKNYILYSGNYQLHTQTDLNSNDRLSYRFLTTAPSNKDPSINCSFRPDQNYPSFGFDPIKIIRSSNWLSSANQIEGSVRVLNNTTLKFRASLDGIQLTSDGISNFISPTHINKEYILAESVFTGIPYDTNSWNASGLGIPTGTHRIHVVENYQLSDNGNLLTTGNRQLNSGEYNRACETIIYETLSFNIVSNPYNTGIFYSTINIIKPYHTLDVSIESYDEVFRFLNNTAASQNTYNNYDISFNIENKCSGIFHFDTMSNKNITSYPYSKIRNITHGNYSSFNIAVESGYWPSSVSGTGLITLSHPKVYGLTPESVISNSTGKKTQAIFNFLNNNILKNGIYDIESLGSTSTADVQSIYLYDFARSFNPTGTSATGLLLNNYTAYNITDSKFSIWGRNFNGDTIIKPFRDLTAIIQEVPFTCATGYLCIKLSGVPSYVREGDQFWIDIEPKIYPQSSTYISCTGTGLLGSNILYVPDAINSGIILGMNVISSKISPNSYITQINDPYIIINGTVVNTSITGNAINFNRETSDQQNSTNALRVALQNHIMGYHPIYKDRIQPNVASILVRIPPFYYNINNEYYSEWNSTQNTRGVNVWRSSGNLANLLMITGVQNIQTDKDPNYDNKFLSMTPLIEIVPSPTGYVGSGIPNNLSTKIGLSNSSYDYGFNLNLNKYLSDMTISGIYKPTQSSGLISATAQLDNASDWTTYETTGIAVPLIIKDIDTFRILGIDSIYDGVATPLNLTGNNIYIANNLPINDNVIFRVGLNGGTAIPTQPPYTFVSGLGSSYTISQNYITGMPVSGAGLSLNRYNIGPFSNTWYIDFNISNLNNIDKFALQFLDPLGEYRQTCEISINNPLQLDPYISNISNTIYYNTSLASPWVIPFDIENVSANENIGISGSILSDTNIISSGLVYTEQLSKWQGYIVGHSTSSNSGYDILFGITGSISPIILNTGIMFTGINLAYGNKITNNPSIIRFNNVGAGAITGYFNYQKPQPYTYSDPILSASNNPFGTNVVFSKINTDYEQITSRNLYTFYINNIGATGYNLTISALDDENTTNFTTNILVYDTLFIDNVSILEPTKFIGDNWLLSFDINGGAGDNSEPIIQIFNAPSKYNIGKTFNSDSQVWNVRVTGDIDFLGRNNLITGVYKIDIYAKDDTGNDSDYALQTYSFPVDIQNIKPYYGIKNKDYFINLDLSNPTNYFDANYSEPSINTFMPSAQTKIYDLYNYLLNIYEHRYSGVKLTDKWNTRINLSNLNQEYAYDSNQTTNMTIDVRGLDTDIINVIGLLKLKELEVVSTDYPPIKIVSLDPEEDKTKELNQGDGWRISFGVVGGLSNINYPPTIIMSGLPSLCTGYFPDTNPTGPLCLETKSFSTQLLRWNFAFTGTSNCTTGLYNIGIKAFDITSEDTASTAIIYKPLVNPGPRIIQDIQSTSLFPNCQFSSGNIKYYSPSRIVPCPYATGISGVNIIGSLPSGLYMNHYPPSPPAYTGMGMFVITGTPTNFPINNLYDSISFEVVDKVGKKAKTIVSYNTAGIGAMPANPIAGTLFFPNSGYYATPDKEVKTTSQTSFDVYPSTGLFNCRSKLLYNNCRPQITGTYSKLTSSGITIFTQSRPINTANAFVIFDDNFTYAYNGIYSLINVESEDVEEDPETQLLIPQYSGLLINLSNTGTINGISSNGTFKFIEFNIQPRTVIDGLIISSFPPATVSCNTCILGDGYIDSTLNGTMKASLIANITGNYYPQPAYNPNNLYIPNGPQNLQIYNGLQIVPLNSTGIISEICFSNCYESGSMYLSGVILPMPKLDITDPPSITYNSQPIALATRCAYGTGIYRNNPDNYRSLDVNYYIKDILTNNYYVGSNTFVSTQPETTVTTSESPDSVQSISFAAPTMSSGTVLQLRMYRGSDIFPTFKIDSYDYLEYDLYWIHKASDINDPISNTTYPGFIPIRFGSGLVIPTGQVFNLAGQIIGGNGTGNLTPTISAILTEAGSSSPILNNLSAQHNINAYLSTPIVQNGLWDIKVTGQVIGLTGSYLNNYDFIITTTENINTPYGKTTTTRIPVTFLKPMDIFVPVTSTQTSSEIYVNYGNKWNLTFTITGGDRPPRYWSNLNQWVNTHKPTIEINNDICTFDIISLSYNQILNEWSVSLRSRNIITSSDVINISIQDAYNYISKQLNVVVL